MDTTAEKLWAEIVYRVSMLMFDNEEVTLRIRQRLVDKALESTGLWDVVKDAFKLGKIDPIPAGTPISPPGGGS